MNWILGLAVWAAGCALILAFVAGAKKGRGDDEVQG